MPDVFLLGVQFKLTLESSDGVSLWTIHDDQHHPESSSGHLVKYYSFLGISIVVLLPSVIFNN